MLAPVGFAIIIDALKGLVIWGCKPVCMGGEREPVWYEGTEFCGIGDKVFGANACCGVNPPKPAPVKFGCIWLGTCCC